MKYSLILLVCSTVVGCASKGFNRGALREQLVVKNAVVTDAEIAKTLDLKPNLSKPFKLGVYFKNPSPYHFSTTWRWESEDKDLFLDLARTASNKKLVSEVFQVLPSTVSGKENIKSIRLAAARHGADALLIVGGSGDVDFYTNNLGWTYMLLVTALFVPGSQADALFMANASLWDVRNEYLYLTAEAETLTKTTYIFAQGKEAKALLEVSKKETLKELQSEVLKMMNGIKTTR